MMRTWLLILVCFFLSPLSHGIEPFVLKEGDRVVLLGSTFIEREQRYGYWETALRSQYPGQSMLIRNLGWSGDTVEGHARAGFKTVQVGFQRLIKATLDLKPSVVLIGYGTNESFKGKEGLEDFTTKMKRLLTALAPAKARIALLSPLPQEKLGPPLPDPTEQNKRLKLYTDAIAQLAKEQKLYFIDLYSPLMEIASSAELTNNGIHLSAYGYWKTAPVLLSKLGSPPRPWSLVLKANAQVILQRGIRVPKAEAMPLTFQVAPSQLPPPLLPDHAPKNAEQPEIGKLQVEGLKPGRYSLLSGKVVLHTADAAEWQRGVTLTQSPVQEQAEALRSAIYDKNRLFFHRWRPQNVTYLFGFRKHEQGQNAKEIPQFDPLIAEKEKAITKLTLPKAVTLRLIPAREKNSCDR